MISDKKNTEDDFMCYLAERVSPAQLSKLYRCYSEIETFCLKIKVLQNPLFETTDFETIKKVQHTIEQNKIFRITRRRQINKIVDAGQHYYNYIKEGLYTRIIDGKTVEDRSTIDHEMSNQSPPDVEMAEVESPITAYTKTKQDERLLQKHPTVYNQIYNALKASPESQRVTIREICEAINHTTRPAVVGEILNNVSWASNIGDSYIFSEDTPAIAPDTSNTESLHSQNTTFEIDFHADFDLAYTMPERFSYFGQDKETGDSWSVLYGNASQPYSFARTAKKALKNSRETIAQCTGAQPEEIFFTSGGTESNNWAIKGTAFLNSSKHSFITSVIEHHAILRPCADIERMGYPVSYLPVDFTGTVNFGTLSEYINSDTQLVSIMTANNEIGSIQDISTLAATAHSYGAIFHTDAVQAVGHIEIDVNALGVDMLSASAHKFNGPKGIGFLYVRKGTPLMPYASGGVQEHHMRAGTENVASIVGMATALKKNVAAIKDTTSHLALLENKLLIGLSNANIRFSRNGSEMHIPGNLSLSFPGYSGEVLLHRLDLMGICVSTGSACNSKETQISHVLQAIGLEPDLAKGTIRLSFGRDNSENDVDIIVESFKRILG